MKSQYYGRDPAGATASTGVIQPSPQDLIDWLTKPLTAALGERFGPIRIFFLSRATAVPDGITVLLVRDADGKPCAVALCSSPLSPNMIGRRMDRLHAAKAMLGASMGARILDPLAAGSIHGLSYAVLPYCYQLSNFRALWWLQRAQLRQPVLDWLWSVNRCSVLEVGPGTIEPDFAAPLRRLASLEPLSGNLRDAAARAIARLDAGAWIPRHVLMHGDLWKGNILLRPSRNPPDFRKWSERFVVIDWAGMETHGYALFDLVRLAQSLCLSDASLRAEVGRHCQLLGCDLVDARSHLLAALGHILMNLEYFPLQNFISMSENCVAILERAIAGSPGR